MLIGEVSTVNDDLTDNVFAEPIGRFAAVEEWRRRSLLVAELRHLAQGLERPRRFVVRRRER